jgi:uncharacterized protein (TIGR02145 family)
MIIYLVLFSLLLSSPVLFSQKGVIIGNQVWMSNNLDVDTFRNGEIIPQATCKQHWEFAGLNEIPAWCYYEFDESNGKKFGKLYNWFAVIDKRGLAPTGYHIPSEAEWKSLNDFLCTNRGEKIIGVFECYGVGDMLKSTIGWDHTSNGNGNGTNKSGFNGLPGGTCFLDVGIDNKKNLEFSNIGIDGVWWSNTERSSTIFPEETEVAYASLNCGISTFRLDFLETEHNSVLSSRTYYGLSVRCVRD